MPTHKTSTLTFTPDEADLLGRTADALSAYMGKPVLAEILDADQLGSECAIFAIPLATDDTDDDHILVQLGGAAARLLGNKGGLVIADGEVFDCEYLWAIQLSDLDGVRYIKVDQEGEEVAWSDDLGEILPFVMADPPPNDDDDNDDDDNTDSAQV